MLLFFFISFSCLLWGSLFNNASRDLPPSRALAIAEGRLDPISMCAFNEFAYEEPSSQQHTLKEAKSTRGVSGDLLSFQKGDVWLGTDEELLTSLAEGVPELSLSPSPISAACTLPLHVRPNNGFLKHLTSISNSKAVVGPTLEEHQPPACNSSIVTLSPRKKRVLPPPPNNNPLKRGKLSDTSSSLSSKAGFLFDTQLDGKLVCREDQCLERAISVPHRTSHEVGQFSQIKHEAHRSNATANSDNDGNPSLIFMKARNSLDLIHAESTTLAPLHAQDLESENDADNSMGGAQVLIEAERPGDTQVSIQSRFKTLASLQADCFAIKRGQHTSSSSYKDFVHPDLQASMSPVLKDLVVQQNSLEGYAALMAHGMLPTSTLASHHMKAGMDSSKIPTVIKQMQREAKAKSEIRSSSKQSSKVVTVASTPSLLKFFQRAPTL